MFLCIGLFVLTAFFGLVLGFTFKGGLYLVIGMAVSAFSFFVWQDTIFATVAAFVTAGLASYFFMVKEH